MDISIIILTKNAEEYIDELLRAIYCQKINRGYEIICVDSGSKDNTEQICRKNNTRFYKIRPEEFNHGLTRNYAASLAKGEFLIFVSQDAIPVGSNWLKELASLVAKDEMIAGAYCRQIPREDSCFFSKWQIENQFPAENQVSYMGFREEYDNLSASEKYQLCQFDNVCSCIRKSIWEKFKFNYTEFGEDIEWSKRVFEAGYKIAYLKEAAVVHSHALSLINTYRRAYIHHKILYRLFGFKVFPSFSSFLKNLIIFPLIAAAYCIKKEKNSIRLFISLPRAAMLSIYSMLGQYFACFL